MRQDDYGLRLSASDLTRFVACEHATYRDLLHMRGEGPEPSEASEDAKLVSEHGLAHEKTYLERLQATGKEVVQIPRMPFDDAVKVTEKAMWVGAEVIYQGALASSSWGGYPDFLERVEKPSAFGAFAYEVVDTKLKRSVAPSHVLQLCLYSDLLGAVQGCTPDLAHIELGTGERHSLHLTQYADYVRRVRFRLEEFVQKPYEPRPIPCAACSLCAWKKACEERWEDEDSLFQIAGITRGQVKKIEEAGTGTMRELALRPDRVPRMADSTLEKLKTQARLQDARKSGTPTYKLRSKVHGKGFYLLPVPDAGDLFYDIEGDPYYKEGEVQGLEYLHGVWDGEQFLALWAHNLAEEKKRLKELFDFFLERIDQHPDAHIYHYAPYEITALRRLTMQHGFGEEQMDQWQRERRFVDLYAVVRGGVFVSEQSYSIKDMEALYDVSREGDVTTSGGSVVAYEKWRNSRDDAILEELESYNRTDCISTEKLRNWLLKIRPEIAWADPNEPETEYTSEEDSKRQELRESLRHSGLPQPRQNLLYNLAAFHWRESKVPAWAVFDARGKEHEELLRDLNCLGGLQAVGQQSPIKRSVARTYRYPEQETKLKVDGKAQFARDDNKFGAVTILAMDRKANTVTLKMGPKAGRFLPDSLDLLPNFAIPTSGIQQAIKGVLNDQCGRKSNRAAEDLLSRNIPRFTGPLPLPFADTTDVVRGLIAATRAMDNTVLPIQGPPGTGKTYIAARAICTLVKDGCRIAVTSNSHAAILNVLRACVDALRKRDVDLDLSSVCIAHKPGNSRGPLRKGDEYIETVKQYSDSVIDDAHILGGTAWMFSREDFRDTFDYLFVDEAGQVSLANLVGMSHCARNLVLIGDPRQLPQVIQGTHPHPANLSCLEYILGDTQLVEPDRGVFLPFTWRMHPDLCRFISTQFYEGRLRSHESTTRQAVTVEGLPSAGAFRCSVQHEGCNQRSDEEVKAITETIKRLCAGKWTDKNGNTRKLESDDIIVVAPYNAQVNALSNALPGIRVGTVDKFQGQEAPVALVSMTTSSAEDIPRGIDFLFSRHRLNVAVSRGKSLSLVFASPKLMQTPCSTVEQVRLVNALCALPRLPKLGDPVKRPSQPR